MNLKLWARQGGAIARLELKRFFAARRWVGVYAVALAPVIMTLIGSQMVRALRDQPVGSLSQAYANLFQLFILRFGIFISCGVILSQAFRGEILEKTLHFYLLAPARREVIAVGKYVAGDVFVAGLFTAATVASLLLIYSANPAFSSFFLEGEGLRHLAEYVSVTVLASIAYGSIFLLTGLLFKNPGVPAFFFLVWESLNFALPASFQKISVVHYLLALLPVVIDRGPFAVVTEPTSPIFGIPILLAVTAVFVAVAAWTVRYTQITYSAD
jgi:ABC-type transport system involved in multi-copper enzyme maturation permease subunit